MTQDQIDNWVIAYMEDALGPGEKRFVQGKLATDTQWHLTLQRIKRTRQTPDSQVTFPWKEQLYKPKKRLPLSKTLPAVLVVAALCIFLGLRNFQQLFYQTDKTIVTQESVQKRSKDAGKAQLPSAGIAFDVNAVLNAKSDTSPIVKEPNTKPVHTENNLKKRQSPASATNQQKEPNQVAQSGNQLTKFPPKMGVSLTMDDTEIQPKAPTFADFPDNHVFARASENQVKHNSKDKPAKKAAEDSQQKSLLAKAVANVFDIEVQRNQSGSSDEAIENSLQIETNPLGIRAKIRFN